MLNVEQKNYDDMKNQMSKQLGDKQTVINNLTQENIQMLAEIKDSDYRHAQMEIKFQNVDDQVNDIAERMGVRTEENSKLLEENLDLKEQLFEMKKHLRREKSRDRSSHAQSSM